MSVPAKLHAALSNDLNAACASRVHRKIDEVVGGVWLARAEERGRIKVSRVMVLGIEDKVSFGVEERGLVEIGVETVPYKRRISLT